MSDESTAHPATDAPGAASAYTLIEEQAEQTIRREWVDGRVYFSVVDVVGFLTDAPKPRQYWHDMRRRITDEGFRELSAKCRQLKMVSADGKRYATDAADMETLLRIVQAIPSPKAEPVKQWLARVGAERLEEASHTLPPEEAGTALATIARPPQNAPAVSWAEYYEALAALYRRQALYETRLAEAEAMIDAHGSELSALQERVQGAEEGVRILLEHLGPVTLSPEHQQTIRAGVKRVHDATGESYGAIYGELYAAFHVARYQDIPEADWERVAEWFRTRIHAQERRQGTR